MAKSQPGRYPGPYQAVWSFFGSELKRRREDEGLTQGELGQMVFCSGGYISQFEQATRKPQLDVAQRIDEALQTDGFFGRMCKDLINASPYAEYFAAAAELEALAVKICEYAPSLVPGLLQTAPYVRAVTLASHPFATDDEVKGKVDPRMERARLLDHPTTPEFWAVLHENVIRTPVGGEAVMADQLDHIAALIRRRRILVQVLPYTAGAHAMMSGMMTLMEFADAPDTVYTEGVYSGQLLDDPALVRKCRKAYDLVRAAALSPKASLALIESVAEDYKKCSTTS